MEQATLTEVPCRVTVDLSPQDAILVLPGASLLSPHINMQTAY